MDVISVSARSTAITSAAGGATTTDRSRPVSTPARLRRMLAVLLAETVLLGGAAMILQRGLQATTQTVRDSASPAYLDAVQARAALSDADRAAWQSFRSGVAQLMGPGQQYQNDITVAGQALERLAALDVSSGADSSLLQTISGQLVNYQGLVEQADAAYRRDVALGAGSKGDLGFAYLRYASDAMRDPQGGLLASIGELARPAQQALDGELASPWADPAMLLLSAVPALLLMAGIVAAQAFLRRRFNRALSPPLLLAAAAVIGLFTWQAVLSWNADSAFTAARSTALPGLTGLWQAQIAAVDAQAAALQSGRSANTGGLNGTATGRAASALDADLAAAQDDAGLPIGIPVLAAVTAVVAYLGCRPRLAEYRGGAGDPH
jgi:hypothetical protein